MSPLKNQINIPKYPHPGSFGAIRKYDIHTGIDLYCKNNDNLFAIEDGITINVCRFTGDKVGSPWWENTDAILIKGKSGVILYGELSTDIKIGSTIKEGDKIGNIKRVLKEDKGKPMHMLHLELYESDYNGDGVIWELNGNKPDKLKDPTDWIEKIIDC